MPTGPRKSALSLSKREYFIPKYWEDRFPRALTWGKNWMVTLRIHTFQLRNWHKKRAEGKKLP